MKYIIATFLALLSVNANAYGPTGSSIAPPEYINRVELKGDLGFISKNYRSLKKGAGALAIHSICYDKFDGARGAEYEDLKYIIKDLKVNNIDARYWVVDAYTSKKFISGVSYKILRKDGVSFNTSSNSDGSCSNFTSSSASFNATVVNTATNSLELVSCDSAPIYIACVK